MKTLKLTFYEDAGHGFLRVPLNLLVELDIAEKITPYSYMNHKYAYLEEDCDYSTFMEVAKNVYNVQVTKKYIDGEAGCREYGSYKSEYVNGFKVGDTIQLHDGRTGQIIENQTGRYKDCFIVQLRYGLTRIKKNQVTLYLV